MVEHSQFAITTEYIKKTFNDSGEVISEKIIKASNKDIVDNLKCFLEDLTKNFKHCSNCGAILPELLFLHNDICCWFVCHRITDKNDKTIATTDYDKHAKYFKTDLDTSKQKTKKV